MLRDILPQTVDPNFRNNDLVRKIYLAYNNADLKAQQEIHNEFVEEFNSSDDLTPQLCNYFTSYCTAMVMLAENCPLNSSVLLKLNSTNYLQNNAEGQILYILMGYARGGHSDQFLEGLEKSTDEQVLWNLVLAYISCGNFKKLKKLNTMHHLENKMRDDLSANIYEAIDLGYNVALKSGINVSVNSLIELMSYVENERYREHLANMANPYIADLNLEHVLQKAAEINRLMKQYHLEYDQICALNNANARIWLLQGQQLVENGTILYDAYMVITCSLLKLSLNDTFKVFQFVNKKLYDDCVEQIKDEYNSGYFPARLFYYPSYRNKLETTEERYMDRINFCASNSK